MTTMVLEPEPDVLLLEDELVTHDCPFHADVEIGDWSSLTDDVRDRLALMCTELATAEEEARRLQLWHEECKRNDRAQHEAWGSPPKFRRDSQRTITARSDMERTLGYADRQRERMRRLMANEPEVDQYGPAIDLWA